MQNERERRVPHFSDALVGREAEINFLRGAVDDACSGRGRIAFIVGEPGIGKTRLCEEAAALAGQQGMLVLWGRCAEQEGAPPYWPWVQVIRRLAHAHPAAGIRDWPGYGEAANLVTELVQSPTIAPPAMSSDDPAEARFRLLDGITRFLTHASHEQTLLMVLENLHWADQETISLVEFMGPELASYPILLLCTYRDTDLTGDHPLHHALASLNRERHFQRLAPAGMSVEETSQLVTAATACKPSDGLASAIREQTEGNPFFIGEVAQLLEQRGALQAKATDRASLPDLASLGIPEGVREVIRTRLRALNPETQELLEAASVIGREFDARLLARVLDAQEVNVLAGLDEALEARLVVSDAASRTGLRFTHALVRQALYERLGSARPAVLHARVAEELESAYADRADEHAAELVLHFSMARSVLGTGRLARYSLAAGEQALGAYAYEEAIAHFERGLAAKEGHPSDLQTADLFYGLGRAQAAALERHAMQKAIDTLGQAFDAYLEAGDPAAAVAAAAYDIPCIAGVTESSDLIRRAIRRVEGESKHWGWLNLRLGKALSIEANDLEGAQEALEAALWAARGRGDRELEARALSTMCESASHHLRVHEIAAVGPEAVKASRIIASQQPLMRALLYSATVNLQMGEPMAAREQFAEVRALAEKQRDAHWLENILFNQALWALLVGHWQGASEFLSRADEEGFQTAFLSGLRVLLEIEKGEHVRGEQEIQRLLERTQLADPGPNHWHTIPSIAIPLGARITGDTSRLPSARRTAQTVIDAPRANPNRRILAVLGLALIAVIEGDGVAAGKLREELSGYGVAMAGFLPLAVARVRGLAAAAGRDWDSAEGDFREALDYCRAAGYRPELAWTCSDYAEMLLERGIPAYVDKAIQLQQEGLVIARELGMKPLETRLTRLSERLSSLPKPWQRDCLQELTDRELAVLGLIATGYTNRQIADALFISPNTVAFYVKGILSKTGCANRAEASVYAVRRGFV